MKTEKWMPAATLAVLLTTMTSCEDWGQQDPPAGNQVYPTLENVAAFDFDADEGLDLAMFTPVANPGGSTPQIIEDEIKGKVLELNNGHVFFSNPFSKVTLQNAASFTFWMKQPVVSGTDADGNEVDEPQDLSATLLMFENETGNGTLSINANGGIKYSAADGEWAENDPATVSTGYMTPGEWHYVGVVLKNDGYEWYVDGDRKVSKTVPDFDCSKLVKFANNVPTMIIGGTENSSLLLVDDLKIYRNALTEKETARPALGGGSGPGGVDPTTFEYVIGDPVLNVGTPDCTAGWWTEFSNYYRIPSNTAMNFRFVNHTSGGGNWNNWNLCVSTDADRGDTANGYLEYFVIRSDLYGWGESYNGDNWTNEGYGDWDKFRADMEGAIVNVSVVRTGTRVDVTAVATCADGTVYTEKFFAECGDANDVIRAFFIVDGSYLEFDRNNCYAYLPTEVNTPNIGTPDCAAAWWTEFSDYFTIPANMSLRLNFINHTSGGGNWNNWNLCVSTDADRGDTGNGYLEYFVIRSDLYGWGESYNGENWTNEGYGDWDKFRVDMEGANVDLHINRAKENITVSATASCKDGTVYIENFKATCGDGSQLVRAFLIVDGSYLEMRANNCYLYVPVYK